MDAEINAAIKDLLEINVKLRPYYVYETDFTKVQVELNDAMMRMLKADVDYDKRREQG